MKSLVQITSTLAFCVIAIACSHAQTNWQPYIFSTVAGTGTIGSADGTNQAVSFNQPYGVTMDGNGNIYIADTVNNTIRRMAPAGANWVVTTIAGLAGMAGSADGTNSDARFWYPMGLAVDDTGVLYVADEGNCTVRKISFVGTNWIVATIAGLAGSPGAADGTNSDARFQYPTDVALGANGILYVTDGANNTIRQLTPAGSNWVVTTIAGGPPALPDGDSTDGTNTVARFFQPMGLALDSAGCIYVADFMNDTIRKLTPDGTNWVVTTLAGQARSWGQADGTNSNARFGAPVRVAVDRAGNVFVTDGATIGAIRKITSLGGNWVVSTVAAGLGSPAGLLVDRAGNLLVADLDNTVRKGVPVNAAPALGNSCFNHDRFTFRVAGAAGQVVVIQGSADLTNWTCLQTNIIGPEVLPLSMPGASSQGYYRAFSPF